MIKSKRTRGQEKKGKKLRIGPVKYIFLLREKPS